MSLSRWADKMLHAPLDFFRLRSLPAAASAAAPWSTTSLLLTFFFSFYWAVVAAALPQLLLLAPAARLLLCPVHPAVPLVLWQLTALTGNQHTAVSCCFRYSLPTDAFVTASCTRKNLSRPTDASRFPLLGCSARDLTDPPAPFSASMSLLVFSLAVVCCPCHLQPTHQCLHHNSVTRRINNDVSALDSLLIWGLLLF